MAKSKKKIVITHKKKTSIGNSDRTKHGHKGGGANGSTPSGSYKKKYRGQGK